MAVGRLAIAVVFRGEDLAFGVSLVLAGWEVTAVGGGAGVDGDGFGFVAGCLGGGGTLDFATACGDWGCVALGCTIPASTSERFCGVACGAGVLVAGGGGGGDKWVGEGAWVAGSAVRGAALVVEPWPLLLPLPLSLRSCGQKRPRTVADAASTPDLRCAAWGE